MYDDDIEETILGDMGDIAKILHSYQTILGVYPRA